jgi:site-specific recombinase XerC
VISSAFASRVESDNPANKSHDTRAIQGWLGHGSITRTAVYTASVGLQHPG